MGEEKKPLNYVLSRVSVLLVYTAIMGIVGLMFNALSDGKLIRALGGVTVKSLEGAVLAFDSKEGCRTDDGWKIHTSAQNRFIVGVGPNSVSGDTGGDRQTRLEPKHIPPHIHRLPTQVTTTKIKSPEVVYAVLATDKGNYDKHIRETKSMGENVSFDNMPPYIAFYLCKRN